MHVLIASKTLKITQAMRDFAQEQAEKLERLQQRVSKIRIVMEKMVPGSKREEDVVIKIVVGLPGKTIVIKHTAHDMYEGLVEAADKVMRQARKFKEKRLDQQRRLAV